MAMIPQLCSIFGTRTKALEILFLIEGLKDVVRQGFYLTELPQIEKFCLKEKLFLVTSPFTVILDSKGYSHAGQRASPNDPKGMFFVYISRDEKKALQACYYETVRDHTELGRLFGYPECCIRFFEKTFSSTQTNLEIPSTNPFTNLSLRGQDIALISHFPCSAECSESVAIGEKRLSIIRQYDPQLADWYAHSLGKRRDQL